MEYLLTVLSTSAEILLMMLFSNDGKFCFFVGNDEISTIISMSTNGEMSTTDLLYQ